MQRHMKTIAAILLVAVMVIGMAACSSGEPGNNTQADSNPVNANAQSNTQVDSSPVNANAQSNTPGNAGNSNTQSSNTPANSPNADPAPAANTGPITVVWYPNESSNTHVEIRAEVNRLIEQATGRPAVERLTTDYTIAIEAIASGAADIAMAMGAVGYIEAKNRNPAVDVIFVNSDADGGLDGAKYFAWLCVDVEDADNYISGYTFSIDNIKGKTMSFVSNSSTSGFRVPTTSIISHFESDSLTEDDLIEGGSNMFFREVYFGGSHQGSAVTELFTSEEVAGNELLFYDADIEGAMGLYKKSSSYGYVRTTDSWYDPYR